MQLQNCLMGVGGQIFFHKLLPLHGEKVCASRSPDKLNGLEAEFFESDTNAKILRSGGQTKSSLSNQGNLCLLVVASMYTKRRKTLI